jgi:DNA-binding MarR family transcriptional regulator
MGTPRRNASIPASRRRLVAALEIWAVFRLDRAAAALREMAAEALDEKAVSLVSFAALSVISQHGPISPSTLSERIGVDRSTMSDLIAELHDDGLVRRGAHPIDGRRHSIALTGRGHVRLEAAAAALATAETSFFRFLDDYERDDLRHMLRRLEPPERAVADLHHLGPRRHYSE